MKLIDDIRRLVAPEPPTTVPQPKTEIVGGASDSKPMYMRQGMLTPEESHVKNVRQWKKIYRRGGPAATCIDVFPQFVLSNGYEFCADEENEALKEKVEEWADQPHVNFDQVLWSGVLDAVICGTAFQEIIPDSGQYGIWGIVPRDAASFRMVYDKYGRITHYEQVVDEGFNGLDERVVKIQPAALLSISLFPVPGEMYGASLVERAYDDIMRDADMIESITCGVHRHGTAKNHVRVGIPGESVAQIDLSDIKRMYERVGAKNDWITDANVEIRAVDSTLSNLESYSNITLQRLAAAFGIPDELLGLGRGSTEATASVRIRAFFGTITTLQNIVARTYSQSIIDRITGVPGSVWLEFNEVSDESFFKYATAIAALRTGMDADAVIPADWAREKLGIPADEDPLRQGMAEMVLEQKINPPAPFGNEKVGNEKVKVGASKKEDQMPDKKLM